MKLILISGILMMLLTGCAANKLDEPVFEYQKPCCVERHTHHDIQQAKRLARKHNRSEHHHDALKKAFRHEAKASKSTPILTDGFMTVAHHAEQQPIIQAAPFQVTVIRLEPGEKFTNISSGDPSRWSYAVAISGKDDTAQQNILIKPSLPDISTNLVITTDKRLYNLRLTSTQTDKLTRNVNFWYPEEPVKHSEDTVLVEEEPIEEILCQNNASQNHYRITTAGFFSRPPSWQPVRVFDDEVHTTIQFPNNISQRDLPTLFVLNNGQKECVNYRFKSPYMVVDKIFEEATLVSGVGASQQAVILTSLSE